MKPGDAEATAYGVHEWDGDWLLPVVCTHRGDTARPLALICHAYSTNAHSINYTAPWPRVQQTRETAAIGQPGFSRDSIRFYCQECKRSPLVDRQRWARELDDARRAGNAFLLLSDLD